MVYRSRQSRGATHEQPDSKPSVRYPPETTTTSTASLFLLKYWATMRVEVSLTKPTPIPEVMRWQESQEPGSIYPWWCHSWRTSGGIGRQKTWRENLEKRRTVNLDLEKTGLPSAVMRPPTTAVRRVDFLLQGSQEDNYTLTTFQRFLKIVQLMIKITFI